MEFEQVDDDGVNLAPRFLRPTNVVMLSYYSLSHWAYFTVRRFTCICVCVCILCVFVLHCI